MKIRRIICGLSLVTVAILFPQMPCAFAQCSFTSGSTSTNGDFNPPSSWPINVGWSTNGNVITVTNSPDGIFHFTSIYIETNWVVKFTKNTLNTPVFLLVANDVTINGEIDLSGSRSSTNSSDGGVGGPGGYDGGKGQPPVGNPGFGPGANASGGHAAYATKSFDCCGGAQDQPYGVVDIQPMIGGSGGGGPSDNSLGSGGGGGGGAILIATSGTLTCNGSIVANGATPSNGGSGGSIRLIANTIQGEGAVQALSESPYASGGRIRIEACTNKRVTLTGPPATFGAPGVVFLATNPTIRVTSIAGTNTPVTPTGTLTGPPDVYLPGNFTNPAVISVSASNISAGTPFKVIVTPAYGTNMIASNTLAGTYAFSSGIVTMAVYADRVWRVNALIDYIPRPQ